MSSFWLLLDFIAQHFWPVAFTGFFLAFVFGLIAGRNPNSFIRRLGRAGEAFWRELQHGDAQTHRR